MGKVRRRARRPGGPRTKGSRADEAVAAPQAGQQIHRPGQQRIVECRGFLQRRAARLDAPVGEAEAQREGAREDAARSQLAPRRSASRRSAAASTLAFAVGAASWCSSIRAGGSAVRRIRLDVDAPRPGGRATGPARPASNASCGSVSFAIWPRRRMPARAQPPRERRVDPGQHLDLQGGEEPRFVAVEHVDDAARRAELRRDARDQLRTREAARRRRSRARGWRRWMRSVVVRLRRGVGARAGQAGRRTPRRSTATRCRGFRGAGARRPARRRGEVGVERAVEEDAVGAAHRRPARAACRRERRSGALRATPPRPCRGCPAGRR